MANQYEYEGMKVVIDRALADGQIAIVKGQQTAYMSPQTATEIRERAREYDALLQQKALYVDDEYTRRLFQDGVFGLPGQSVLPKQMPPQYQQFPPLPLQLSPMVQLGDTRMNLSAAVMLFPENGVRPVKVEYDPDVARNNNPNVVFKTVDETLKVDDLVIVDTHTRHGYTVAKVKAIGEVDVPIDFENPQKWGWIVSKVDIPAHERILAGEKNLIGKVAEANANKMRNDLKEAMGLSQVSLADVFKQPTADALPSPASPPSDPEPPQAA